MLSSANKPEIKPIPLVPANLSTGQLSMVFTFQLENVTLRSLRFRVDLG